MEYTEISSGDSGDSEYEQDDDLKDNINESEFKETVDQSVASSENHFPHVNF